MPPDEATAQRSLDRRQYLRHFVIILSGNGAAQAVNLVGYPFLARLYSPHEFGLFSLFIAAAAIPGTVACGRFEFAIPIAPKWGVSAVLRLCILISASIGAMAFLCSGIYWWARATPAAAELSMLFGVCVFLTGVNAAASYYLMRFERYRPVSVSILVRTGSAVASQVGLAFLLGGHLALILGFTLGLVAQATMLAWLIWTYEPTRRVRGRNLAALFARFRRQVSVDFPSTLVAALALSILTFALAILYDQRTVGLYSIGNRLVVVPLAVFNDALSQVFFQKASRAKETKGHLWDEMKFSITMSGLLSLGVLAGIVLFARPFVRIFLGPTWLPAADMLIVLAPMLAIRALAMSVATTVFVLRAAHWLFIHNVATVALPLIAFAIASVLRLDAINFLAIVSVALAAEYALFATFLAVAARRGRTLAVSSLGGSDLPADIDEVRFASLRQFDRSE